MFAVYVALCLAHPAGMGFGDVKLAGVLGMATGWVGWGACAVGLFLAFLLGGVAGIAVVATRQGRAQDGPAVRAVHARGGAGGRAGRARRWPRATST